MKRAITNLTDTERYDLKREAKIFCHRQGNAHLGNVPTREDIRHFFKLFRQHIEQGTGFDTALGRIDADYMAMDDM